MPSRYDIIAEQGADLNIHFTYRTGNTGINLSGYTASLQVRPSKFSNTVYASIINDSLIVGASDTGFNPSLGQTGFVQVGGIYLNTSDIGVSGYNGGILLKMSADATKRIRNGKHYYDIELESPMDKIRLLEGSFDSIPNITKLQDSPTTELQLTGPSYLRYTEPYRDYSLTPVNPYKKIPDGTQIVIELVGEHTEFVEIYPSSTLTFDGNKVDFKLKVIDEIENYNSYSNLTFTVKVSTVSYNGTNIAFLELPFESAPIDLVTELLVLNPAITEFNLLRNMSVAGNYPAVTLKEDQTVLSNYIRNEYDQTLYNSGGQTILLGTNKFFQNSGFNVSEPNIQTLTESLDPPPDFHWTYARQFKLYQPSTQFTCFLNDPLPGNTFSSTFLSSESSLVQGTTYQKHSSFDENDEEILKIRENKVVNLGNAISFYINKDTERLHFGVGNKLNLQYPQVPEDERKIIYTADVALSVPLLMATSILEYVKTNESFNSSLSISHNVDYENILYNFIQNNFKNYNLYNSPLPNIEYYTEPIGKTYGFTYASYDLFQKTNQTYINYSLGNQEYTDNEEIKYNQYTNYIAQTLGVTGSTAQNRIFGVSGSAYLPQNTIYTSILQRGSGFKDFYLSSGPKIKSIKANLNCLLTLDQNGSISITYCPYGYAHTHTLNVLNSITDIFSAYDVYDSLIVHYSGSELENNFWIDSNGLVEYIENENFVDIAVYGELPAFDSRFTFVFALHKNGKVYGRELFSGLDDFYSSRVICQFNNTSGLTFNSILKVYSHSGITQNQNDMGEWRFIYSDNLNNCILQTSELLVNSPNIPVINSKRPWQILTNDIFVNVSTGTTYEVDLVHWESSSGLEEVAGFNKTGWTQQQEFYLLAFSYLKKLSSIINNQLNPNFLSINTDQFNSSSVSAQLSWSSFQGNGSQKDPFKQIYNWSNPSEIAGITAYYFKNSSIFLGYEGGTYEIAEITSTRPNGILNTIKTLLKPLDNYKVIQFIDSNLTNTELLGVIYKTDEQANTLINNNFYSYSYDFYIFPDLVTHGYFTLNSLYNTINHLKKTRNEQLFGFTGGYYTHQGWTLVDNTTQESLFKFNENLYSKFIYKSATASDIIYPIQLDNYYVPIKFASIGTTTLCLLNQHNECLVIGSHNTSVPYFTNSLNYDTSGNYIYDLANEHNNEYPQKETWLFNRGYGLYRLESFEGGETGYFFYPTAQTSELYEYEETTYGLGNPPTNFAYPLGVGMSSQNANPVFVNYPNICDRDICDNLSRDERRVDVVDFYPIPNGSSPNGNNIIIFKGLSGNSIQYASVFTDYLYIQYETGIVDTTNITSNYFTYPVRKVNYSYIGGIFDPLTYIGVFPTIIDYVLGGFVPHPLRQSAILES